MESGTVAAQIKQTNPFEEFISVFCFYSLTRSAFRWSIKFLSPQTKEKQWTRMLAISDLASKTVHRIYVLVQIWFLSFIFDIPLIVRSSYVLCFFVFKNKHDGGGGSQKHFSDLDTPSVGSNGAHTHVSTIQFNNWIHNIVPDILTVNVKKPKKERREATCSGFILLNFFGLTVACDRNHCVSVIAVPKAKYICL